MIQITFTCTSNAGWIRFNTISTKILFWWKGRMCKPLFSEREGYVKTLISLFGYRIGITNELKERSQSDTINR